MFRGKKYVESAKLIDRSVQYDPNEALDLVVKGASAKFDETVELHIKLGVDSRHADQQVRGAVVLPNGTGYIKDMTYEELAKHISVDAVTDTQVFTVSVTTDDLELSKKIVREIIKIAPAEIDKAVEAGSCRIVSDLDYKNTPVSPDVGKYTAVAAFAGFLLAMAYALYRVLSRTFIVTEKDVTKQLEVPVLGVIPLF